MKIDGATLAIRIAGDPFKEIVFQKGRDFGVYLVGGNLRDVILNRRSGDRDFAVERFAEDLAGRIAAETGGKMVVLGKKQLYRIIVADGSTLDFSLVKNSIEEDLKQRDYTVNALGWSPEKGFMDPTNGLRDLDLKLVRMTSRENLEKDPVRIIRAYRIAGELGFTIEPVTREALREMAAQVAASKSERITLEFFRILNLHKPSSILTSMFEDGVLEQIISFTDARLREQARVISTISETIDVLPSKQKMRLHDIVSQNLRYSGLLYLLSLLWNSSRMHLRLSARIQRRRDLMLKAESVKEEAERSGKDIRDILFEIIGALDGAAEDYFIIRGMPEFLSDCERYRQIIKKGLLSTSEIMEYTGEAAGEKLGRAIEMMRRAEFYCKINNKGAAVQFLFENRPRS